MEHAEVDCGANVRSTGTRRINDLPIRIDVFARTARCHSR